MRRLAVGTAVTAVAAWQWHSPTLDDRNKAGAAEDPLPLGTASERIRGARTVVAFTGAGVSAESGVPTYRDALQSRGLWDGLRGSIGLLVFGTPLGFLFRPDEAWRLYCERLLLPIARAHPNAGHVALAELGRALPNGLPIITQVP